MSVWSALLILTGPVYPELRQVARRVFCLNLTVRPDLWFARKSGLGICVWNASDPLVKQCSGLRLVPLFQSLTAP
jgi:hypothetical protein